MKSGQTQIPMLFTKYSNSVEAGDLPKAVEANVRINETSPEIESLLTDFQNAIEEDNIELAQTLLLQLKNQYDEQSEADQQLSKRAIQAIEEGEGSETEREKLFEFNKKIAQTKLARSNFLNVAISYLSAADATSTAEVTKTATETQNAETSLSIASKSADNVSKSVELTPTPTIIDTDSPSEVVPTDTVTMSVTVSNVGDATTDDLSIHPQSTDGVTPIENVKSIGTLSAGDQQQIILEFDLSGNEQVELSVTLREGGTDIESSVQSVSIVDTTVSVREAITGQPDQPLNAAEIQQAISYWTNEDPVPKTGGETITTNQIQAFITERMEDQNQ
jgi:hypothetical protein